MRLPFFVGGLAAGLPKLARAKVRERFYRDQPTEPLLAGLGVSHGPRIVPGFCAATV